MAKIGSSYVSQLVHFIIWHHDQKFSIFCSPHHVVMTISLPLSFQKHALSWNWYLTFPYETKNENIELFAFSSASLVIWLKRYWYEVNQINKKKVVLRNSTKNLLPNFQQYSWGEGEGCIYTKKRGICHTIKNDLKCKDTKFPLPGPLLPESDGLY